MAISKILTIPNPLLRQKSKKVAKVDKKTLKIIADLLETVKSASDPEGLGLSAIQIGQPIRIFVAKTNRNFEVFINPEITFYSKKKLKGALPKDQLLFEGCLSVPQIYGFLNRPFEIQITWENLKGQKRTKRFQDKLSVCLQHEFDHLEGIIFTDRLLKEKAKIYELKKDKNNEDYFQEISL
jgi:peptide deformylase